MSWKRLFTASALALAAAALVSVPVVADEADEAEEMAPTPPPPPRQPPPPPLPRNQPPPPPRYEPPPPREAPRYEEPVEEWDSGFTLEPEILYMEFRDLELEYAQTGPFGGPYDSDEVEHDFDVGWRLGLGYRWRSRWDMMFRGTHLDSDDSHDTDDSKGDLLTVQSDSNNSADVAFGALDTTLEYIDGEAGYTWGRRDGGQLRLLFGIRGARFDQDAMIEYDGEDAAGNVIFLENDADMWGPRVGVEGRVWMGAGWTFNVSAAIAALQAEFDQARFESDNGGVTVITDFEDDPDEQIFQAEGRLGFGWVSIMDAWTFGIDFGLEAQMWEDLVWFVDSDDDDLNIDGGFVRARFLF